MPLRFGIIRVILGLLLLAAALKLHGLNVSALPRVGLWSQPWVQSTAAVCEFLLGSWLLSGAAPHAARWAALATFALFAAVSGYLGVIGVASCGCFGVIRAHPWHAFAVDIVAIVLLLLARPPRTTAAPARLTAGLVAPAASVVAALIVLTAIGTIIYGSPGAALAHLRGEPVALKPSYIELGTARPGEIHEHTITIMNYDSQPVKVFGGTTDCSCSATQDLPVEIPPHESRTVRISVRLPSSASRGMFTRVADLITDHPRQPVLRLRIGCRIVE